MCKGGLKIGGLLLLWLLTILSAQAASEQDGEEKLPEVTGCMNINTGNWEDLSPLFQGSREVYSGSNNKYVGTAELLLWLSFDQPNPKISLRSCPDAIDPMAGDKNMGEAARISTEEIRSSDLSKRLASDGVPSSMGANLKGKAFYRAKIEAPDQGYHSSYIISFDIPPNCAIGKAKADVPGDVWRAKACKMAEDPLARTYDTAKGTSEADLVVRIGDADNLGFGWPEGFDIYSGASTPGHRYPWKPSPEDPAGTDRIMLGTSYNCSNPTGAVDGYTGTTSRPDNLPQPIAISYDLGGLEVRSAVLQMFVDDFQAPPMKSRFSVSINDRPAPFLEEVLNSLVQTGPVGKLITVQVPAEFLDLVASGDLKIYIDDPTTGVGDAFAIDFVKLLINVRGFARTGSISGSVVDAETGSRLAGASVSASGVVEASTDSDGRFNLEKVPAGMVAVTASREGYEAQTSSVDLIAEGAQTANFRLKKAAEPKLDQDGKREKLGPFKGEPFAEGEMNLLLYGVYNHEDSLTLNEEDSATRLFDGYILIDNDVGRGIKEAKDVDSLAGLNDRMNESAAKLQGKLIFYAFILGGVGEGTMSFDWTSEEAKAAPNYIGEFADMARKAKLTGICLDMEPYISHYWDSSKTEIDYKKAVTKGEEFGKEIWEGFPGCELLVMHGGPYDIYDIDPELDNSAKYGAFDLYPYFLVGLLKAKAKFGENGQLHLLLEKSYDGTKYDTYDKLVEIVYKDVLRLADKEIDPAAADQWKGNSCSIALGAWPLGSFSSYSSPICCRCHHGTKGPNYCHFTSGTFGVQLENFASQLDQSIFYKKPKYAWIYAENNAWLETDREFVCPYLETIIAHSSGNPSIGNYCQNLPTQNCAGNQGITPGDAINLPPQDTLCGSTGKELCGYVNEGEENYFSFNKKIGLEANIILTPIEYDQDLTILDSNNEPIVAGGTGFPSKEPEQVDLKKEEEGMYCAKVYGYQKGSYAIKFVIPGGGGETIFYNISITNLLELGSEQKERCKEDKGCLEDQSFYFYLQNGQRVIVTLIPEKGDQDLYVYDPQESLIDVGGSSGNAQEKLEFTAQSDGIYIAKVDCCEEGGYSIIVMEATS